MAGPGAAGVACVAAGSSFWVTLAQRRTSAPVEQTACLVASPMTPHPSTSTRVPDAILPFWRAFCATISPDLMPRFYEAFHFADTEAAANELAELALRGTKRATAGLLWAFEAVGTRLPARGDLSVVTDWRGTPVCVIETVDVAIVPFDQVTEQFAATEGEGDGSLRYWREAHWASFTRECQRIGRTPTPEMPVVCEEFRVVYRRQT